jgi:hypothetical protein
MDLRTVPSVSRSSWRLAVVSICAPVVLWIAIMPHGYTRANINGRVDAYWVTILIATFAIGFVYPRVESRAVLWITCTQFLLAVVLPPIGDDDGLWMLIFPFLLFFALILFLAARVGGKLRLRMASDDKHA